MENILIISTKAQGIEALTRLLLSEDLPMPDSALSAEEGRELASQKEYDLILIDPPIAGGSGESLAVSLVQTTDSCVLLFVNREQEQEIEKRMWESGVFTIAKPVSRYFFHKSVTYLRASMNRLSVIKHQKARLQKKNEEIRLVNRAKGILMEYLSMTEPQAHKYLEKQAMDLRITKAEVAKRLLSTYEN